MKQEFDIFECIRNKEIRDYFRENAVFTTGEQIQLILRSYASIETKYDRLCRLSETLTGEGQKKAEEMIAALGICRKQIASPEEKVLYIGQNGMSDMIIMDNFFQDGKIRDPYDKLEDLIQDAESYYRCNDQYDNMFDHYCTVYVDQILLPENEPHQVRISFKMAWIDDRMQIVWLYPDTDWLRGNGISEEAIWDFTEPIYPLDRHNKKLPFEDGCKLKIRTPEMEGTLYGVLQSEQDEWGNRNYWLVDENDFAHTDLSGFVLYGDSELSSGYSVFDWVERSEEKDW